MDPKMGPDLRAHIVLSCCYLQQFSKVVHFKMGPHLGTILGASLGAKLNKTLAPRKPKKECEKKVHTQKFECLSERLEAPRQPPLARPGLNKKQQFEQQQQQQQQQLQPWWLDVDFVVNVIVFFITVVNTYVALSWDSRSSSDIFSAAHPVPPRAIETHTCLLSACFY